MLPSTAMNQPPSRHPLFAAIACIALAGAWSTGAYEAETGTSVALLAQAQVASAQRSAEAECVGPRGPARSLCLFRTTSPSQSDAAFQAVDGPMAEANTSNLMKVAARKPPTQRELR